MTVFNWFDPPSIWTDAPVAFFELSWGCQNVCKMWSGTAFVLFAACILLFGISRILGPCWTATFAVGSIIECSVSILFGLFLVLEFSDWYLGLKETVHGLWGTWFDWLFEVVELSVVGCGWWGFWFWYEISLSLACWGLLLFPNKWFVALLVFYTTISWQLIGRAHIVCIPPSTISR